ncbi:MAG: glycosyltransferase family 4 protein [Balneolaceae bacterium]|nr:glycosyltransferase family 4 protein [Balneolaceae bacterium]
MINTSSTFKGGSVQVARSFIEECVQFPEHEYHVLLGDMLSDLVSTANYPENFFFYNVGYRPATRVLSFRSQDHDFKDIEKEIVPDVVFTTSGPAYWRPEAPHVIGYNLPHYIYGESPYFKQIPLWKRVKWFLKGKVIQHYFKRDADAYVVQTDDVNRRLRDWIKSERVYTVSNTYSRHYDSPKQVQNKLPERKETEFRLLTLSAWYPHKNLKIIPDILELLPVHLKERVRFVLTLPEASYKQHFRAGLNGSVINIGPVKPDEGPALYKECDALFLPTLLECFSASYAEAMRMEKPIVTSDMGFAHSVCGGAALYANPEDPNEFAEKISDLADNPDLRRKLTEEGIKRQKAFPTARERAEQYLNICKRLADEHRK